MKIALIFPDNWFMKLAEGLQKLGIEVYKNHCDATVGFIIGGSISQMDKIFYWHNLYPKISLINYNWDLYEWQFKNPRPGEYGWQKYGQLLKESKTVFCPSQCTVQRMKDFFNLDNGKLIKTFVPVDHLEALKVKDGRYVLQGLRDLPDQSVDWFEKACKELNIPYISTRYKRYSDEEYKKLLAECSFTVSSYYEASTGGLHLIEGYYLGKPCLISDSCYHGGKDYFRDRARYFKHDYDKFKESLKEMWDNTPQLNLKECRDWVRENYSAEVMAKEVADELQRV